MSSLLLLSCKTQYKITPNQNTNCITRYTGVNVRLENIGKINFSTVIIHLDSLKFEFNGLEPNTKTCYQNLPYVLSRGVECEISFELKRPTKEVYKTRLSGFLPAKNAVYQDRNEKIKTNYLTIQIEPYWKNKKRVYCNINYLKE